ILQQLGLAGQFFGGPREGNLTRHRPTRIAMLRVGRCRAAIPRGEARRFSSNPKRRQAAPSPDAPPRPLAPGTPIDALPPPTGPCQKILKFSRTGDRGLSIINVRKLGSVEPVASAS